MKKLNITKKQYDESKYFTKKYGSIKFVSESGKMYKTDKGVVLTLEASPADLLPSPEKAKNDITLESDSENESLADIGAAIKKTGGEVADKVKKGVKKVATKVGDAFHGIYRKDDRVTIKGKAGDVEGSVISAEPDKVVIKPDNERSFDESDDDSGEVTRGELTDMLTDVVKEVEKVCNDQDCSFEEVCGVEPEGEADEGADADEVVATKDEVAEVLSGVIEKVEAIADQNGIELPDDEDDEGADSDADDADDADNEVEIDEDTECAEGDPKCECGGKCRRSFKESVKRAKRARLVREAIAKRAKLRKVRESLRRRAKARKVLESIRHRRALKKIMESRKARKAKVMESRKARPMHFKRVAAK